MISLDTRRLRRPAAAAALGAVLAACTAGASPTPAQGGLVVEAAWARPSTGMAHADAAYFIVKNTGSAPDALIGASSPVATTTEVHETYKLDSPTGSMMPGASAGMAGAMGMRPIARIEIPAGGSVEFKAGSYHVMLIDLKQEVKVGDTIELTLSFEKAGKITVRAEVRAS